MISILFFEEINIILNGSKDFLSKQELLNDLNDCKRLFLIPREQQNKIKLHPFLEKKRGKINVRPKIKINLF